MNMPENADKYTVLLQWLSQHKDFYISPKVVISKDQYGGTSLSINNSRYKNEKLISIPSPYLLNKKQVFQKISDGGNPVYDSCRSELETLSSMNAVPLLCFYILVEWFFFKESFWSPFFDTLPPWTVFKDSVPCLLEIQSQHEDYKWYSKKLLSAASLAHSDRMLELITKSWSIVENLLIKHVSAYKASVEKNAIYEKYLHIYMLINSRCLYYNLPKEMNLVEDNFTMVPLVDFINHDTDLNGNNCYPKVMTLSDKFEVFSGKSTDEVGELYFHYGAHSNDFLLNEYGFIAEKNESNFIDISRYIIGKFSEEQKTFCEKLGYFGDYSVAYDDVSFRTIVALCTLSSGNNFSKVEKLANGILSETSFPFKGLLDEILIELRRDIENNLFKLETQLLEVQSQEEDKHVYFIQNLIAIYLQYIEIIDSIN